MAEVKMNGSFTGEIKAELANKEAVGSCTGEIDFTNKAKLVGNKEAARTGMVTEDSWITFVYLINPPEGIKRKADPTATKERVPDSFIDILKNRRLFQKFPPVNEASKLYYRSPELLDLHLSVRARKNTCIDLHVDVLRQHASKGFAEVGVDFSDGIKRIFILPQD